MPHQLDRSFFLDWVRLAESAGFHSLGTLDRPNYDSWDPLTVLAGAATVTDRIRLVTSVLVLPIRNEVEVAKQVAVIDHLSQGRIDLGVGVGSRPDDYEALGTSFAGRGARLGRQVVRMREVWAAARAGDVGTGLLGPAPFQEPGVPIIVGGTVETAVQRALEIGDGYMFGSSVPVSTVAEQLPKLRARAADVGKKSFTFSKIQYCAVGEPDAALKEASQHLLRFYRNPQMPFDRVVQHGHTDVLVENARQFAGTGLDELIYLPLVFNLDQVDRIGQDVLPPYL